MRSQDRSVLIALAALLVLAVIAMMFGSGLHGTRIVFGFVGILAATVVWSSVEAVIIWPTMSALHEKRALGQVFVAVFLANLIAIDLQSLVRLFARAVYLSDLVLTIASIVVLGGSIGFTGKWYLSLSLKAALAGSLVVCLLRILILFVIPIPTVGVH